MAVNNVERTCETCNKTYYLPKHRAETSKYCSQDCYRIAKSKKRADISAQRFGRLTAIKKVEPLPHQSTKYIYWLCQCDCGNETTVRVSELKYKRGVRSCGCLQRDKTTTNYTGKRFGMLVAIEPTDRRKYKGAIVWEFKCDCGNYCYKALNQILHDNPNCGCITKEKYRNNGYKSIESLNSGCVYDTNVKNLFPGKIRKHNTSGYPGVYWAKHANLWRANICFRRKRYNLGYFKNKEDAIKVRKHAESMLFEQFLEWYEQEIKNKRASQNNKSDTH